MRRPKLEVALIGIFIAAGIKPGIEVRIGDGFFSFVRDSVRMPSAPPTPVAGLSGPVGWVSQPLGQLVNVADEGIFDVRAADGGMRVEAAIGAAEA